MKRLVPKNKTGGVVTNTIMGVGGLIIGVIIVYTLVSTILDAGLLGESNSTQPMSANESVYQLTQNFSAGIQNVSKKLPTILLIVAVVFLFGALVLLIRNSRAMGIGGGAGASGSL